MRSSEKGAFTASLKKGREGTTSFASLNILKRILASIPVYISCANVVNDLHTCL